VTDAVDAQWYLGRTVVDQSSRVIGSISQVFIDEQTGRMDWISVTTGLFGLRDNYAPLIGSWVQGEDVVLLVDKELVKNSPKSVTTDRLTPEERQALSAYYRPFLRRIHPESLTDGPGERSRVALPGDDHGADDHGADDHGADDHGADDSATPRDDRDARTPSDDGRRD